MTGVTLIVLALVILHLAEAPRAVIFFTGLRAWAFDAVALSQTMPSIVQPVLKLWPLAAAWASAAMLAIAHAFETFGDLSPCTLCYYQRDVYWTALPRGVGFALYRVGA